ncbi:progestin and adipoQ receptor family member 3-like isoform X5 [Portunus trituberculatus]|uniref:progestin and adipoQ receptor family member 3-like isoform X5 n=1 Tax=Portunus trituberculatus TaxID=210409 RepID=UPI001E1D0DBA|nr:progestin and adipoQ receptor family member 3-like isoform X5 [Portunus trituberculatus]
MCQQRRKNHHRSTVSFHQAPPYLRTNPYIIKGYRANLSTLQCFRSLFSWNNETLNVWSHLAGFLVFLGLLVYDVVFVFHQYRGTRHDALVVAFVLVSFMVCMLLSSLYHTLNCRSEESCRRWLSYDIFGISASFLAIFLSGIYYGFWCPEYLSIRNTYMALVGCLFFGAMIFLLNPRCSFLASSSCTSSAGRPCLCTWARFLRGISQLWHLIVVVALFYWHQTGLLYAKFRLTYGCRTDPLDL